MSQLNLLLLLALIMVAGSTIQASVGFGNAVFAMCFLPLLFPYSKAVGFVQIFSMALNLSMLCRYWRHVDLKTCLPQLTGTLLASFLVTRYALTIDASVLYSALGFLFIGLSVYFTVFMDRIHLKAGVVVGGIDGILSGTMNGFFGVGGPVSVLYYASVLEDKLVYLGTVQFCFFAANFVSVIQRIFGGVFEEADWSFIVVGIAAVFAGNVIGGRIVDKINGKLLRKLIYIFVGINGGIIVLQRFLA